MSDGNSHFMMAVGRIDGGRPVEVADAQLRDVVAAIHRTGKPGSVTMTLEMKPNGELGIAASVKITAKAPQLSFGQSFFYVDREGDLTRQAPDMIQQGMFKREKENG
jgi:hypothetical protein